MKYKGVLIAAALLAGQSQVHADNQNDQLDFGGQFELDNTGIDSLFEKSSLKTTYKSYYWNEDPAHDNAGPFAYSRDEWGHATLLDYETGFIKDFLNFHYSFSAADDLHIGSKNNKLSNFEPDDGDQHNAQGMAGTEQAFIEAKLDQGAWGRLVFTGGKKRRTRDQYKDDYTRLLPASSVGYDFDYNHGLLDLYFSEINKFSPRTQDNWGDSLTNFRGETIDHLRIFGGGYRILDNLTLSAEQAESKEYIKQQTAKLSYTQKLISGGSISYNLRYGNQKDAGDLFESTGVAFGPVTVFEPDDDLSSHYWDADVTYQKGNYYLGLSNTRVRGDDYARLFFAQDHGTWSTNAKMWNWFSLEGEDTWTIKAGMNFADFGLPGLRWDLKHARSSGAEGFSNNFSRFETNSFVTYNFDGLLKGLSVNWLWAAHRSFGTVDGISRSADFHNPAEMYQEDSQRLYLTYTRSFF